MGIRTYWRRIRAELQALREERRDPVGSIGLPIGFNSIPVSGAWGGGNQWLQQIIRDCREKGKRTSFRPRTDWASFIVANSRQDAFSSPILQEHVSRWRESHPQAVCLQRVNDTDFHRGSDFVDRAFARWNTVASHTVFVSRWALDYHASRWFDRSRPHSVIHNAADDRIFFPPTQTDQREQGRPFRLVTHHWSTHPSKGFKTYQRIDRWIADGTLKDFELRIIGRVPEGMDWRCARVLAPLQGHLLADELRSADAYITASRWEACGNHFIEGVQCGLPLLYTREGGGTPEIGESLGLSFGDDEELLASIRRLRDEHTAWRSRALAHAPSSQRMLSAYRQLLGI